MKYIFFLLILSVTRSQLFTSTELYKNGNLKRIKYFEKKENKVYLVKTENYHEFPEHYFEDSTMYYKSSGNHKDWEVTYNEWGEYHGIMRHWYVNGQKRAVTTWVNHEKNGPDTTWYENGQISGVGVLKNGCVDGWWSGWYEDGIKMYKGFYEDCDATSLEAWNSDGSPKY